MQVPIRPFRHFCCSVYRLAIKRTEKNRVKEAERLPCAIIVTYCVLVS